MKYLKKFYTEEEYTAYKNSENFTKPNVSWVIYSDKVYMTCDDYSVFEVTDGEFEVTDGTFEVLR
jgi:hypothetical protein